MNVDDNTNAPPGTETTKTTTYFHGIEPIIYLLLAGIVFFALLLLVAEIWFRTESDVFQVFSNVLSAFVGAFLLRVKPPDQK